MQRGLYRGVETRTSTDLTLEPRRLARAENTSSQTGITTVTDLTGLAIAFSVNRYPVKVTLWIPFPYGTVGGDSLMASISDAAGTSMAETPFALSGTTDASALRVEELITVAGAYSRKGRFRRDVGTGTANTFASSLFVQYIEAQEIRV